MSVCVRYGSRYARVSGELCVGSFIDGSYRQGPPRLRIVLGVPLSALFSLIEIMSSAGGTSLVGTYF